MNHSSQTLPQFSINRFTLSFKPDIEREFQESHYEKALPQVRFALLVGLGVYAVFGVLDAFIFPDVKYIVWTIRFAGVLPFILAAYVFSYSSHFKRFINVAPAVVILLSGLGIIGMIIVAPSPQNSVYYAGLILVIIYGYTFFKIRFIWATLTGLLIVIAYEIAAIWLSDTALDVLLSNNFFFLGGNLIGMFASYNIELVSRQEFIQNHLIEDEKTKVETLNKELAKYISPELTKVLMEGEAEAELKSTRKLLTVFFSDIAGFTTKTDSLEPEELSELLNGYFNEMVHIVKKHGGTLDKFIGDAIMVFFGDPTTKGEEKDALECVRMAIKMREAMDDISSEWDKFGLEEEFRVRMGIYTAYCTVGNFGSTDQMSYTIMGNAVNLASRLETAAEPGEILISHHTHTLVKNHVKSTEAESIELKGFSRPIRVHRVLEAINR